MLARAATWGLIVTILAAAQIVSATTPARPGSRVPLVAARAAQPTDAEVLEFIRLTRIPDIAPLGAGEIVALALNAAEGGSSLVAYVGSPAERPLRLPAGEWWLYVLGADGRVRQSSSPVILSRPTSIPQFTAGLVDVPGDPSASTAAMGTLVHFALSSHLATLAPLGALAEARATGAMTGAHQTTIAGLAAALSARQQDVLAAADVLAPGAIGGSLEIASEPELQVASVEGRAPTAGIWDKIKGSFLSFFTSDAMTGASARKDIDALTQSYPPGRREELFQVARQRHPIDAENADQFFERLRAGAYDPLARQIHQDFIVGSEDYAIDAADARRRPLDTAARDGAQLVKDGAAFYADVVKTVLGARFGPDFDKGWDLANKIGDQLTELDKAISDPAGYARDWALGELSDRAEEIEGKIKDRLKEKILGTLRDAGLSESDAERLADEMTDRIAEASKEKLQNAAAGIRDQVVAELSRPPARPPDDVVVPTRPPDDVVLPTQPPDQVIIPTVEPTVQPPEPSPLGLTVVAIPSATVALAPVAEATAMGLPATATPTRLATPGPSAGGGVEGVVRNATNGQAIPGATVSGGGRSATTDAGGRYQLTGLPTGATQVTASATGFISDAATVMVPTSGNATQTFALSQALAAGQTRIVLTWGATPRDLDSHLYLPGGTEIYYGAQGNATSSPFAALDVDDTSGLGPETITITRLSAGTYIYSVFNFSNEAAISSSGARVQVYRGEGAVQSFTVPSGTGRWWNVFTMDGSTGAITAVNRISAAGR